jgi:TonB-dependent starch-binding outer membrane protein SusC
MIIAKQLLQLKPKHCKGMNFCIPKLLPANRPVAQILRFMKLLMCFMFLFVLNAGANTYGQKVTIQKRDASLVEVFRDIQAQTGYDFIFSNRMIEKARKITINVKEAELLEVLKLCFQEQPFSYSVENNTIVIKEKQVTIAYSLPPPSVIRGRIINDKTEPVVATVLVKGTRNGAVSNSDGWFELKNVEPDAVLIITASNIEATEVKVSNRTILVVLVKTRVTGLDEVQIIAYGTTTKRLSTGSVHTVTAEQIEKHPVPNVLQALQGTTPGLFIVQQTGLPGGAFDVQIRSRSTLNANQPLYIIDGVAFPANGTLPLTNRTQGGNTGPGDNPLRGGNALNYLDPSMIESVSILEGADATAIYGSRGAYGVIIITTKKGKAGSKPRLNINTYTGVQVRGTTPDLLNTQQYLALRREAFKNDGTQPNPASDKDVTAWDTTSNTNWLNEFTGNRAITNKVSANYSGGNQLTSFLIGGTYSNQGNIQKGKGYARSGGLNFNISTSTNNRRFNISLAGNVLSDVNTMVPYDFSTDMGINQAPNAPSLFLPDGKLNWSQGSNPAKALYALYRNVTNNIVGNLSIKYDVWKGLSFNATLGYNMLSSKEFKGYPTAYFNPASNPAGLVTSTLNYYSIQTITADPNISYTTPLGIKGKLKLMAGGTFQDQKTDNHGISGTGGFFSDALLNNPASVPIANQATYYNLTPNRYNGFFAIVNYNWANKYLLNLNGRRDGSTKFGPESQFGNFGSVGAAWIFSEEPWFKKNIRFINFAKLKGSYGTVGGDGIPAYSYLNTYILSTSTYQGNPGLAPGALSNPLLQWETNRNSEIGINLEFLNSRISVEATYYRGRTSNQLVQQPLSSVTGFVFYAINSPAEISTSGYEFLLTTTNIKTKTFSWRTMLNVTVPKSKLVAYPGLASLLNINYAIGRPVTGIVLYKYNGVDPLTGLYSFTNKAGVTGSFASLAGPSLSQTVDRTEFVDLAPKYFGGLQNIIEYKSLSVSFLFQFTNRIGKNYLGQQLFAAGWNNSNQTTLALTRWQKPGDETGVQKAGAGVASLLGHNNFVNSTGAYSNATYARLQNLHIAYDLPEKWMKRLRMVSMSVYLAGQNLLTISEYGDLDPENLGGGRMPPMRMYTGGINVNF